MHHYSLSPVSPGLVSDRCGPALHCLFQVVVVGQDLHEEIQLKSLRLQNKCKTKKNKISYYIT